MNEQNSQLTVALAIVAALAIIAIGLILAGIFTEKWEVLAGGIGAAIGALATALNAPSGMSAVIAASKKPAPAPEASDAEPKP